MISIRVRVRVRVRVRNVVRVKNMVRCMDLARTIESSFRLFKSAANSSCSDARSALVL